MARPKWEHCIAHSSRRSRRRSPVPTRNAGGEMNQQGVRIEKDSMGEVHVPSDALYGAQTQRAVDNFPISGLSMPRTFIRALGLI